MNIPLVRTFFYLLVKQKAARFTYDDILQYQLDDDVHLRW